MNKIITHAYHIIAKDFIGNTIYTLNTLKLTHPELAQKAAEKYIGRESDTQKIIYSIYLCNNTIFN